MVTSAPEAQDIYLVDLGNADLDDEPSYLFCYHIETWFIGNSPRYEFIYAATGEDITVTPEMMDEANIYPFSVKEKTPVCSSMVHTPRVRVSELLEAFMLFLRTIPTKLQGFFVGLFNDFVSQFHPIDNSPKRFSLGG